jgi:hypothetical protein
LKWVEQDSRIDIVNMSAGNYKPNCKGDCALCEAARRLSRAQKKLSVAAGNVPGINACPAKASDAVIVTTEVDSEGKLAPGASPAGKTGFATMCISVVTVTWIWGASVLGFFQFTRRLVMIYRPQSNGNDPDQRSPEWDPSM